MKNEHLGSDFDGFLEEEGLRVGAEAAAIKRVYCIPDRTGNETS